MRPLLRTLLPATALAAVLAAPSPAAAGPAGDTLGACLVDKSTPADRGALARWMFVVLSAHSDMRAYAKVPPVERERATHRAADIFSRLLTVDCLAETRGAVRTEGLGAMQAAGVQLAQVATQELLRDPGVAGSIADIARYLDPADLAAILAP
jgi:hypothetical protein